MFWGHGCISSLPYTKHADGYLVKNTKKVSQIPFWFPHSAQTVSLSEGHPVIFSLPSVIIPFPPRERKDRNNPAEIYGSPGAKLLCRSKWKTRAAVAEWDSARSRVSRPHGARSIDTDSAHYMSRLYDQPRSVLCCETLSMYDSRGKL